MATETVIPEVQNMVNEEVKTAEQEVVPICKENKEDVVEENPKNEELASPEATIVVSAERTEDKEIDSPAILAVEKVDNVPVLDVGIDTPQATEEVSATQDVSAVSVPLVESVEKEPEEQPKISDALVAEVDQSVDKVVQEVLLTPVSEEVPVTVAEVEAVDRPAVEVPLTPKPEEVPAPVADLDAVDKSVEGVSLIPQPEEVPAPVAKVKAADKPIKEVLPTVEPEEVPESKLVEESESVVEVDVEAPEKSELATEVETKPELIEPQASVADEITKNAELLVTESLVEKQTLKDEEVTSDVVENVDVEDTKNEPSPTPVDVVGTLDNLVKEAEKVVEVETEEKKEKVGESKESETTKPENTSATGVAEKTSDEEKISKDDDVVSKEKKEESVKDVAKASVETSQDVVEKLDVVDTATTIAANEPVGEPRELVLEAKTKDTVETDVDKLETAAEVVEEIAKSDAPNPESSKDVVDAKDLPKQEVPAKTTPKHSNNIMSKVKQSIVKVKKAIIGKSPSSKTITSDAKDDIQVK